MTLIFITDLDGTLLGKHDLNFDLIKPDLAGLLNSGIVLVIASSKTKIEIESFCDELDLKFPLYTKRRWCREFQPV